MNEWEALFTEVVEPWHPMPGHPGVEWATFFNPDSGETLTRSRRRYQVAPLPVETPELLAVRAWYRQRRVIGQEPPLVHIGGRLDCILTVAGEQISLICSRERLVRELDALLTHLVITLPLSELFEVVHGLRDLPKYARYERA